MTYLVKYKGLFYYIIVLTAVVLFLLYGIHKGACVTTSSQNISGSTDTYALTLGGSSNDAAYSISSTTDGGFIVGGYTWSFGYGNKDMMVIKMSKSNSIDWQYTYGGADNDSVQSIKQTTDGGYVVAGYTNSFGAGCYDMWILKLDSAGTPTWQNTYGGHGTCYNVIGCSNTGAGISGIEYAKSIEQTSDGGYIVLGYTGTFGAGSDDIWVLKLNSNGTIKWQKTYGTTEVENSYSIKQISDGGYIIAGNRISVCDLTADILFIRLDADGNVIWAKTYGNGNQSFTFSAIESIYGGYIVAGYTNAFGTGDEDVWVLKLDPTGAIEWQKTYGGTGNDFAYSILQTTDGGYLVAGSTNSFGSGAYDVWALKLFSNGEIQWQNAYGGPGDDFASSYSIAQTSYGGYLLAGNTDSYGAGGSDFWVVKVAPDGSSGSFTTHTQALSANTYITGKDIVLMSLNTGVTPTPTNVSPVKSSVIMGLQN
ncbi:MAG: hypothetical protein HQK88_11410 [Nitrospirae bacterium]|nr:hypothetical protein [Nitrospirota bacterium]MBF0535564.1 hypothetical protein [Nitrospirota bacterium]MBF0617409.1 hypothetical protein [Nitrospirota bacterium]